MEKNEKKEIGYGVILSYSLLLISAFSGFFITPYVLQYVGESAYGVYKSVSSISASLAIADLGLGTTTTRYMAKYFTEDDHKGASNFLGMVLLQLLLLSLVVLCVGVFSVIKLPVFYQNGFNETELILGRQLLSVLVINMVLHLFGNLLFGVLGGYQKFLFSNSVKLGTVLIRILLIFLVLPLFSNVLVIVLLDAVIAVVTVLVYGFYIVCRLNIKPQFCKWDMNLFKESAGYTILMFIQSITVQFNGNVDNILLGAQVGAVHVTIYSMALLVFGMYENLSGSIANIMLPTVTRQVLSGADSNSLQRTVEKAGRFQLLLLAAALGGFLVLGKDFYKIWLGNNYSDCYYLVLILIVPVTFPMVQNVVLSVLRAKNRMIYRTVTLAVACLFNIVMTIVGIRLWGYWGAAIGTAFATILNFVMMNLYYHKILHFHILRMYWNIFKKVMPSALLATLVTYEIRQLMQCSLVSFVACAIVFLVIYGVSLLLVGVSQEERKILLSRLVRNRR